MREWVRLHAIDQAITGVFDIRVINHVILEEVRKGLGADAAVILHLNPLTNTLDLNGDVGLKSSFIKTKKLPDQHQPRRESVDEQNCF